MKVEKWNNDNYLITIKILDIHYKWCTNDDERYEDKTLSERYVLIDYWKNNITKYEFSDIEKLNYEKEKLMNNKVENWWNNDKKFEILKSWLQIVETKNIFWEEFVKIKYWNLYWIVKKEDIKKWVNFILQKTIFIDVNLDNVLFANWELYYPVIWTI